MIYLNLICISWLLLLFFISINYNREEIKDLDKKQHPLKVLYPLGFFILNKFINRFFIKKSYTGSDKVGEALNALHLGEKTYILRHIYQSKKIAMILTIFFFTNVLSIFTYLSETNHRSGLLEGKYLKRAEYGNGNNSTNLHVKVVDGNDVLYGEDLEIEIKERQMTVEEINQHLDEGIQYIDSVILLDNSDANTITSNLYFPSSILSKKIKLTWFTEDKNVIDTKGGVYNDKLNITKVLWVKAVLKLQDREATYIRYFKVYPKEYTQKEMIEKQLLEELEKNNKETLTKDRLVLPTILGKQHITWSHVKENQGWGLFILGLLASCLIYFFMDKDLLTKVNKRNQEMLLDYPDIINKFTLLVGAGMSLSNAWSKIAKDYIQEGGPYKYAYEEMNITARELSVGVSEITAYERFGRRVKLLPYLRFSSFLARNVKKGSKDLLELLEFESLDAFEERKELAKRFGEEAGTKLLIPMMLMLIIVLAIILVPAFSSFQF